MNMHHNANDNYYIGQQRLPYKILLYIEILFWWTIHLQLWPQSVRTRVYISNLTNQQIHNTNQISQTPTYTLHLEFFQS